MLTHVLNYLLAKFGPSIEHRHHDPAQLQPLVRARVEYLFN